MFEVFGFDNNIHKCVPCINAKRILDAKKLPYEFISVVSGKSPEGPVFDEIVVDILLKKLNRESRVGLTMPQIFAPDGTHIGGFTELMTYLK